METLQHKFSEVIPDDLEEGVLYISMERSIAIHLCVCGCKNEVVTPLSPTDWKLIYNGLDISLRPSIGNWEFKCKSHYFITENKVEHAGQWTDWQITDGRNNDKRRKRKYYNTEEVLIQPKKNANLQVKKISVWSRFSSFFGLNKIEKRKEVTEEER